MGRLAGAMLLLGLGVALAAASPGPGAGAQAPAPPPAADTGGVLLLDIKGGIGPATRDYLVRGLAQASSAHAAAVVLRIDTPGGLDAATRDINQAILAADVPVIAWVAPQGARAASAGTYILYACHLAAMAPATSLGAATPVEMGPAPREEPMPRGPTPATPSPGDAPADAPAGASPADGRTAMERKVVNDAAAYLRGLAELRGRDAGFAERAVREAATLTANQALAQGVVEILAPDIDSLLAQADGRVLEVAGRRVTLRTTGVGVTELIPDWRARFLAVLTNPAVAYMLLLVGMYGLIFEGYSPGAVLPGVVGAICLLLALYAMQVLPVNYAGVALVVLGVGLMAAEFAMPSFGALGLGGLVALVIGSLILFDTDVPGYGVPGRLVAGIGLASGLAFMGVVWLAARARRRPVTTGVEELLGEPAVALEDFAARGRVRTRGEVWQAETTTPVARGQPVRVRAVNGLVLVVEPAVAAPTPPRPTSPSGGPPP